LEELYLMVNLILLFLFYVILKDGEYELDLFSRPWNAFFNILVLQTTANFPDIMLPIYRKNRFAALYFIAFFLINNIILFNLSLSVFYVNYKKNLQEKIEADSVFKEHEERFKKN